MSAYYNEHDLKTAAWLRELIKAGLIADGEVDTRSIVDVQPADLRGFQQCHFFAGIGGWSYALRLAGWPDDRECWTGSCPCQPFSSAGTQTGGNDPRHLWPTWFQLIRERRPVVLFGEQVESAVTHGWLDLVHDDLEGEGYAVGPVGLPAACVGADHERARVWFVADSRGPQWWADSERRRNVGDGANAGRQEAASRHPMDRTVSDLADMYSPRCGAGRASETGDGRDQARQQPSRLRDAGSLADANGAVTSDSGVQRSRRLMQPSEDAPVIDVGHADDQGSQGRFSAVVSERPNQFIARPASDAGDVAIADERGCEVAHVSVRPEGQESAAVIERGTSFWSAADWIPCADGKWRPVEPGTFPLAHGLPARVGRLRGYGNAIVPQVAAEVIAAYMELTDAAGGWG